MEKILEDLLQNALKNQASDIHMTWDQSVLKVELRKERMTFLKSFDNLKLLYYLQYISNMDIGNQVFPQTGNFEFDIDGKKIYLRFAIMYSKENINGVIRILNSNKSISKNNLAINYSNDQLSEFFDLDNGLILISGPTASGKTTTLYTMLKRYKFKKIYTIEDPIEGYIPNIFQLEINTRKGIDYDSGIKHLMRHDPDIIVIGEIRDLKTANMAIRAALTGHLVIATIHASSAILTISRFLELGIEEDLLTQVIKVIINQRLIIKNKQKKMICEVLCDDELANYFKNKVLSKKHMSIDEIIKKIN